MAKFKRLILTELGNTTEGYDWNIETEDPDGWFFSFYTENYGYNAFFQTHGKWIYSGFDLDDSDLPFPETNEGNQFKIVATIINMARYAWNNRDILDVDVKGFSFDAGRKRTKLYKRFIYEQFPDAEVFKSGYEIKVKPSKNGKV